MRGRAPGWSVQLLACLALAILVACSRPRPAGSPVVRLALQPQSAAFEVPYGDEVSEDFRLTTAGNASVEAARTLLTSVQSLRIEGEGDPDLRIEPLAPGPGVGPGLRIHASGRRVGFRVGTLQVVAQPSAAPPIPLLFALRVRGTLTVVPTNPVVDLRAADPAALITVRSTQPGFAIAAAEIVAGPFMVAAVTPDAGSGGFLVRVTVDAARFPPADRGAAGTLAIRSNDRIEPRKVVPLFAFGRAP